MKIYAADAGDMDVGIWPNELTLDWNVNYPTDKEERESLRRAVGEFATQQLGFIQHGSYPRVVFWDECYECGSILPALPVGGPDSFGGCTNPSCISCFSPEPEDEGYPLEDDSEDDSRSHFSSEHDEELHK